MIGKPDATSLDEAISSLRDMVGRPQYGWKRTSAGNFAVYCWPHFDVARWLGEPTGVRRAFRGTDTPDAIPHVCQALQESAQVMQAIGVQPAESREISVFLWDADINLPSRTATVAGRAVPQITTNRNLRLSIPLARVFEDAGPVIILPASDRARDRQRGKDWLEVSAVHEGFHVLLREWLGIRHVRRLFSGLVWQKIEEMCAVWFETKLRPKNRSHLDYGRGWLATLMLTHADDITSIVDDEDREDYPHYVLLSVLDELFGKAGVKDHWLPEFWKRARGAKVTDSPWKILDEVAKPIGGLGVVFEQAMIESMSATPTNAVIQQIVDEFGQPAATYLTRPEKSGPLWLPSLAGHFFQIEPHDGSGGSSSITIRASGNAVDIERVRVSLWKQVLGGPPGAQIDLDRTVTKDAAEWVCNIPATDPLLIVACNAGVGGGAVRVEVEAR